MTYDKAHLRELGDNKHIVAYVEKNNPAYCRIKKFKRVALQVPYFDLGDKGKVIGGDFYFCCKDKYDRREVKNRLECLLGTPLERFSS